MESIISIFEPNRSYSQKKNRDYLLVGGISRGLKYSVVQSEALKLMREEGD